MAITKQQFLRYRIIDQELIKNDWVKTTAILQRIERQLGETVDRKTVQNDINAMINSSELGYYAPIEYNRKKQAFGYADKSYSIMKFSLKDNEVNALKFYASCLDIYSSYGLFKDFSSAIKKMLKGVEIKSRFGEEVSDIVIQTDTQASPGSENLDMIIQCIAEKRKMKFVYTKFGDADGRHRVICPYMIKEYKNRWYVIGLVESSGYISTFGLERMAQLEPDGDFFEKPSTFDAAAYFKNAFGITVSAAPIETVVLEFHKDQAPYIKSLPIHPSQKVIKETKRFIRISIEVIPCYELNEYILSKTPDVKVLAPSSLAKSISVELKRGFVHYE